MHPKTGQHNVLSSNKLILSKVYENKCRGVKELALILYIDRWRNLSLMIEGGVELMGESYIMVKTLYS